MSDPRFPSGPSSDYEPLINYEQLLQNALRLLMREALRGVADAGELPGEHHFYIGFSTTAEGVQMSNRLRAQYPEQMVIVLQHQFGDLTVNDDHFTVRLTFGGIPEPLVIPFDAVFRFEDPAVNFALQFGMDELAEEEEEPELEVTDELSDVEAELSEEDEEAAAAAEANKVVSLDAFRKGGS